MSALAAYQTEPTAAGELGQGTANFVYRDKHFDSRAVKVLPGEYFASGQDIMIVTLLGSCVAACIQDPQRNIGGMNHFLLPHDKSQDSQAGARYGVFAMEVLINALLQQGAQRKSLQAKVFGGGRVVHSMTSSTVGHDNGTFVLDFLRREGIEILAEDLGGDRPRRVHYFPHSGRALVKLLGESENSALSKAEHVLEDRAAHSGGDVELFT